MQSQLNALKKENAALKSQILGLKSSSRKLKNKKAEEDFASEINYLTDKILVKNMMLDSVINENGDLRKLIDPNVFKLESFAEIFRDKPVKGSVLGELHESVIQKLDDIEELEWHIRRIRAEILVDLNLYIKERSKK